jgi:hypothetical protein
MVFRDYWSDGGDWPEPKSCCCAVVVAANIALVGTGLVFLLLCLLRFVYSCVCSCLLTLLTTVRLACRLRQTVQLLGGAVACLLWCFVFVVLCVACVVSFVRRVVQCCCLQSSKVAEMVISKVSLVSPIVIIVRGEMCEERCDRTVLLTVVAAVHQLAKRHLLFRAVDAVVKQNRQKSVRVGTDFGNDIRPTFFNY